MNPISLSPSEKPKYAWYVYPWRMIRHPLTAGREVAAWRTAWPGLAVVLAFGLYLALGCYRSYLHHDYPPPPQELRVWIETWGEFSMLPLPVLQIPLEQYRLFMAIISLPVTLGSWLVMAALARRLTHWFGSRTTFKQYLNLFAFSFFPFWFLSALGDTLFSETLGEFLLPGLRGENGPLLRALFIYYPPALYTVLFGLAAIYNGLAAYAAASEEKQLRWWQAAAIGWSTFILPLVLVSMLYR